MWWKFNFSVKAITKLPTSKFTEELEHVRTGFSACDWYGQFIRYLRVKKVDGKFLFKFTVPHTTATLLGINADASMLCGFVSELVTLIILIC